MTTDLAEGKVSKGAIILITLLYWLLEFISEIVVLAPQMIQGVKKMLTTNPDISGAEFTETLMGELMYPWYANLLKLGVLLLILYLFKRQNVNFFKKKSLDYHQWLVIVSLSVASVALSWAIEAIVMAIQPQFNTANEVALDMMTANSTPLTMFIMIVILAPLTEEIMMRGVFIGVLFKERPYLGLIISAVIFAMLHTPTDFLSFVVYVTPGLTLGLIYIKTKWIGAPIIAHALNNLLAFLS